MESIWLGLRVLVLVRLCGVGLYMKLAGGATAPAGVGIPLIVIGTILDGIAIVLMTYKSVAKFFSKDYKMSQQRKNVDENLRKISEEIKDKAHKSINEHIDENIAPNIDKIAKVLQDSVDNIKRTSEYFRTLREKEVMPLENQIKKEGGL